MFSALAEIGERSGADRDVGCNPLDPAVCPFAAIDVILRRMLPEGLEIRFIVQLDHLNGRMAARQLRHPVDEDVEPFIGQIEHRAQNHPEPGTIIDREVFIDLRGVFRMQPTVLIDEKIQIKRFPHPFHSGTYHPRQRVFRRPVGRKRPVEFRLMDEMPGGPPDRIPPRHLPSRSIRQELHRLFSRSRHGENHRRRHDGHCLQQHSSRPPLKQESFLLFVFVETVPARAVILDELFLLDMTAEEKHVRIIVVIIPRRIPREQITARVGRADPVVFRPGDQEAPVHIGTGVDAAQIEIGDDDVSPEQFRSGSGRVRRAIQNRPFIVDISLVDEQIKPVRRRNRLLVGVQPGAEGAARVIGHRRHPVAIVVGIKVHQRTDLLEIVGATDRVRRIPRLVQRRQQQSGENRDDRYYIDLKKLIS